MYIKNDFTLWKITWISGVLLFFVMVIYQGKISLLPIVIVLSSLAYGSFKRRKLNLKPYSVKRHVLELLALVVATALIIYSFFRILTYPMFSVKTIIVSFLVLLGIIYIPYFSLLSAKIENKQKNEPQRDDK